MGFWDWLTGRRETVEVADDVIWMTQAAKLRGLAQQLRERLEDVHLVLGVAHFTATQDMLREELERLGVPFTVPTGRVSAAEVRRHAGQGREPRLLLVPAEALVPEEFPGPGDEVDADQVDVLVAERHFLRAHDDRVVDFARGLRSRCRIAFHLSLDDPLLRAFAGEWVAGLLGRLGMKESEPIVSAMLTRRIRRAQDTFAKQAIAAERGAHSAEEWLRWNVPDGAP